MGTSRTAISLDTELLEQTDKIAQETGSSRSGIIAIALGRYFQELEKERISATLNEIYQDDSNSELDLTRAGTKYFGDRVAEEEEW